MTKEKKTTREKKPHFFLSGYFVQLNTHMTSGALADSLLLLTTEVFCSTGDIFYSAGQSRLGLLSQEVNGHITIALERRWSLSYWIVNWLELRRRQSLFPQQTTVSHLWKRRKLWFPTCSSVPRHTEFYKVIVKARVNTDDLKSIWDPYHIVLCLFKSAWFSGLCWQEFASRHCHQHLVL